MWSTVVDDKKPRPDYPHAFNTERIHDRFEHPGETLEKTHFTTLPVKPTSTGRLSRTQTTTRGLNVTR